MDRQAPRAHSITSSDKTYTPKEAIDILKRVLLMKGFYLLRRDRMLMVIDLEDGIPPGLVPVVPLASLNEHGESEIVSVIFDLIKPSPDEASAEIEKLRQPQTAVVTLPKSRELQVTDTVARLRVIKGVIDKLEDQGRNLFRTIANVHSAFRYTRGYPAQLAAVARPFRPINSKPLMAHCC